VFLREREAIPLTAVTEDVVRFDDRDLLGGEGPAPRARRGGKSIAEGYGRLGGDASEVDEDAHKQGQGDPNEDVVEQGVSHLAIALKS
jgi:hypothetical protein